jgi:hypothetical protein
MFSWTQLFVCEIPKIFSPGSSFLSTVCGSLPQRRGVNGIVEFSVSLFCLYCGYRNVGIRLAFLGEEDMEGLSASLYTLFPV